MGKLKETEANKLKFDLAKHITTLTSGLIVLIASIATQVTVPFNNTMIQLAMLTVGMALVVALVGSVIYMGQLGNNRPDKKMGDLGVYGFLYALFLIVIFGTAGFISENNVFKGLFETPVRADPELTDLWEELGQVLPVKDSEYDPDQMKEYLREQIEFQKIERIKNEDPELIALRKRWQELKTADDEIEYGPEQEKEMYRKMIQFQEQIQETEGNQEAGPSDF